MFSGRDAHQATGDVKGVQITRSMRGLHGQTLQTMSNQWAGFPIDLLILTNKNLQEEYSID